MLIAFDIGGSRIKAASRRGGLEFLGDVPTPEDFAGFVAALAGFVAPEVRGVAISIAGVVDPETGVLTCVNVPALNGRPVVADLEGALGLPVWVGNDADCFALAEAMQGAGAGHRNVFGVILGTGVGGGLVIDGRIVTGSGGFAGEWGHGPVLNARPLGVDVPRLACGCGQVGCVDTIGGARGIERLHRHLAGEVLDSVALFARWEAGDAAASRTLNVWLDLVAGPLAMVLNVLGSSIVPVGGGLANVPALVDALDVAVRQRVLRRMDRPLLVPAALPLEPGLLGAAIAGGQAFGTA